MRRISVDTADVPICAKCKATNQKLDRHHMGYDSYIGRFHVLTARNYEKFLDTCKLCEECHLTVHWLYFPYVQLWYQTGLGRAPLKLRATLIELCQQWLKGTLVPTPVPSEFRERWNKTRQEAKSSDPSNRMSAKPGIG